MTVKKKTGLEDYYVIKFEKYIDLLTDIERKYNIISEILHDEVLKTLPEFWDNTPIPALAQCFATIVDIRSFLDDKINNTPEEEVKLAKENNIKDVLISKQDLQVMNVLLLAEQELSARLEVEHKIFLISH
jgi:hypothetical protein